MKKVLAFMLFASYSTQVLGQSLSVEPPSLRKSDTKEPRYSLLTGETGQIGGLGEFRAGYFPGAVMIPVHLWGATNVTGLFHVPKNTTLTTLITYARGPTVDADLDTIKIKRVSDNKQRTFKVDVEKLIADPNRQDVALMPNDIVYVENKKTFIDPTWVYVIGFVATILAATAATITIVDKTE